MATIRSEVLERWAESTGAPLYNAGMDSRPVDAPPTLSVQCVSWHAEDADAGSDDGDSDSGDSDSGDDRRRQRYRVHMFGTCALGRRVHVAIDGVKPCFYVRSGASFPVVRRWLEELAGPFATLEDVELVRRVNFWGFTNFRQEPFALLKFGTLRGMRIFASVVQKRIDSGTVPASVRPLALFESNMDPLLRLFHEFEIQPAGWVDVDIPAHARRPRDADQVDVRLDLGATELARRRRASLPAPVRPAPPEAANGIAPLLIASFDIECDSLHGDFPVPVKDYRRLALDADALWEVGAPPATGALKNCGSEYNAKECLLAAMRDAFFDNGRAGLAHSLPLTRTSPIAPGSMDRIFSHVVDDIYAVFRHAGAGGGGADRIDRILAILNKAFLPAHALRGDPVIQIGTTVHVYGERQASARFVHVLGTCAPVADDVQSYSCETEADLIREWAKMIRSLDPDVLTGYNIFGFDFEYMHSRAVALGVESHLARDLTRLPHAPAKLVVREMSSSALGDNILKFIDMPGRVLVDLMKVVQRDHRLESYKLDSVARHFTGDAKDDISPKDIFRLQKGSDEDRAVIARYCVQDCALCNQLVSKLEILANNIGMANVCWVPLSHIFMRGQGVKIFSLVAKQCREDGFLIPTKRYIPRPDGGDEEGYEGAIVLEPETGMYLDEPVSVLDYNSLYPSSMISENISHDTLVLDDRRGDEAAAAGVEFVEVRPAATARPCRFAQTRKGVLPRILETLLLNRKQTRERAKHVRVLRTGEETILYEGPERGVPDSLKGASYIVRPAYSSFECAVLDGLQLAYKVTANSLYGQMGARTSPLYLREVAACTTATGRAMIMQAKDFIESRFNGRVVYGDTDSLFVVFPPPSCGSERDRLASSIASGQSVSREIKAHLKRPHNLEYEKTFFPLVLLSKKRYVGLQYEDDPDAAPKQKSMGIALKRRDYAPVVKQCYGGVIDIILTRRDVPAAVAFLNDRLRELAAGKTRLEDLVISKTLKSHYKFPEQIAHAVLARRMFQRDPGSAPQVNDRIPYVFVETTKKNALMGDRIEHVDFVRANANRVRVDAKTYIENQVMKPCTQLLAIALEQIPGYVHREALSGPRALDELVELKGGDAAKARERLGALREREVERLVFAPVLAADDIRRSVNRCNGQKEISSFFKVKPTPLQKLDARP